MKRFFDILFSLLGLIVLSPVYLAISAFIFIVSGRPVVYKQDRVGRNNKLFEIRKFRTMHNGTRIAATKDLVEYDRCVIPGGRFLRKTSLDELPQLFNVLEGTMSFVGPRPLIHSEKEIRSLREKYGVYSVLPGITGLAQVNGRDNISIKKKALLDKKYVEKQSLLLDFKIILKSFIAVVTWRDISDGCDAAPHFESNGDDD